MSTFESQTGKLTPQSVLIQRYLIIKIAGRGGMSAIYLALDKKMDGRRVAIKEMSQENLDDAERLEAMTRFQQEAHLLGTLNHPNLPHIYDAFGAGGRSFLVMDYIDGKTLLQLLQETGRSLPVDQVLHYANQLCDVLAYLHEQNPPIIFRDLKPTNVMATQDGRVYLIDFGIARFFKEGQPQDTTVLGSPGYAPPEQHGSGQTNPRSDLYALGATLHCCLTNRDPYHAADRFTFAPVRQFNPQVPAALDQLVMRLLSLDEKQRPASAQEVKQELARIRLQMWEQNSSGHIPAVAATAVPSAVSPQYAQSPRPSSQPVQPAPDQNAPHEPLILRAAPAPTLPGSASPRRGQPSTPYPGQSPTYAHARGQVPRHTRVWTPGFLLIFFLLLLLTIGGSYLTFNLPHPYGPSNSAGLDHATETGLTALALILAVAMIIMTRSLMAVLLILLSMAALLAASAVFLQQTLHDIQPSALIFAQLNTAQLNQIVNYALLAAGIISLCWILRRSFTWGDRCWVFLFSAAACAGAYLQIQYQDGDLTKHFLLLGVLILLVQTILMTGQMERRR
jgi:serine/threonine protein kinase